MNLKVKIFTLISLILLLMMMISVGGITRLTRSGLSIVEWRPISGTLPPLTEESWQAQFELYKKSPEFQKINSHFELDDYKKIFWWEYLHRLLGRFIFLFATLTVIVLYRRKQISKSFAIGLPLLIAFQGLVGWLMVRSGLNQRPSVSHYMLSVHFFLALVTAILVYFQLAQMKSPLKVLLSSTSKKIIFAFGILLGTQVLYGCFVSGLKAGLYYPTFPLMGGNFLPPEMFSFSPMLMNLLDNPVTVQWIHRWLGILVFLYVIFMSTHLLKNYGRLFLRPLLHLLSVISVQVVLGIMNLIYQVPIFLAVAHQVVAVLVVLGYFNIVFRLQENDSSLFPNFFKNRIK